MEDYKPNSELSKSQEKPPEKKNDPVVTKPVKIKKKTGFKKFTENIFQEDMRNVRSYVLDEVVVPAIKDTIADVVRGGIDMILFGETRSYSGRARSTLSRGLSKISYRDYSGYSRDREHDRDRYERDRRPAGYDFDEIIFESKGDAELVLMKMEEVLERYRVVTVADFYEFSGEQGKWTDNKYGWTDLRDVIPVRTSDGYILPLPKVRAID